MGVLDPYGTNLCDNPSSLNSESLTAALVMGDAMNGSTLES